MLKKFLSLTIILLGIFALVGCYTPRVSKPFTKEEIVNYLEAKYGEEFIVDKVEIVKNRNNSFIKKVYNAYPKEDPSLIFYVIDKTIQNYHINTWDRALKDTYPHTLLRASFDDITNLCDRLTLVDPSFDDLLGNPYYDCYYYFIFWELSTDYNFEDIETIATQLSNVKEFIEENLDKYKLTQDLIHVKDYYEDVINERTSEYTVIQLSVADKVIRLLNTESSTDFNEKIIEVLENGILKP